MKRWERPLLLFSLALNVSFVSIAATHAVRLRQEPRLDEKVASEPAAEGSRHHGMRPRRFHQQIERWHTKRHARFAARLHLDHGQRERWNTRFEALAPALGDGRVRVIDARSAYREALLAGEPEAIRAAAARLSRAQAVVDSLCAEAMAAEASSLLPDQRARYVRWMFRGGLGAAAAGRESEPPDPR